MDLLDIRKKAKELKAAEAAAESAEAKEDRPAGAEPKKTVRRRKPVPQKPPDAEPPADEAGAEVAREVLVPEEDAVQDEVPQVMVARVEHTPPAAAGMPGPAGTGLEEDVDEGAASDEDVVEYLAFKLASEEYAVKVEDVREIIRPPRITNVPRAPEFVRGIISLRGVIIPVFDIKKRLGLEETEKARTNRIVVVSDFGVPQGMMVDKVTGVVRLRADGIEPPPAVIGGVEAEYLDGVGRIGERLLILFDTAKVLAMEG